MLIGGGSQGLGFIAARFRRAAAGGGGPDYGSAAIGDEIGGGFYAGVKTYADGDYHVVVADISAEIQGAAKNEQTDTPGSDSSENGPANTQAAIDAGISLHPLAEHCVNYSADGLSDFYWAAPDELIFINSTLGPNSSPVAAFQSGGAQAFNTSSRYWTSQQSGSFIQFRYTFPESQVGAAYTKTYDLYYCRPIRRVPV